MNNLSTNVFELCFYQKGREWKHNFFPVEMSKNNSDRDFDILDI